MQGQPRQRFARSFCGIFAVLAFSQMLGCEVDSFFDPSKLGYFEFTPTTTPILKRIDVIEQGEGRWEGAAPPTAEDLIPGSLAYELAPGDVVEAEVWDLVFPGTPSITTRRIDQSGNIRLPHPLRDVPAAGYTLQELEEAIYNRLHPDMIKDPVINVSLIDGRGFHYTMEGAIPGPGLYALNRPDVRLTEALALAGGVPIVARQIYIIRQVPLTEEIEPFSRDRETAPPPDAPPGGDVDIDDLIDQLPDDDDGAGAGDIGDDGGGATVFRQDSEPIVDIDNLQLRRVSDDPLIDVDDLARTFGSTSRLSQGDDSWAFIESRGEWIRVRNGADLGLLQDDTIDIEDIRGPGDEAIVLERIIEVDAEELISNSSLNIVIRPGDRVYIDPPLNGLVYIEGEIARPGVYQLPAVGELTLMRLVATAGGPGPLAIPERVDFRRRLPGDRQATVRVNLAAMYNNTEPDIYLKPDDHIIIGTSWVAAPLAVIRNGFRATYGFGFLLDRNFGNDVFGPPPINLR